MQVNLIALGGGKSLVVVNRPESVCAVNGFSVALQPLTSVAQVGSFLRIDFACGQGADVEKQVAATSHRSDQEMNNLPGALIRPIPRIVSPADRDLFQEHCPLASP